MAVAAPQVFLLVAALPGADLLRRSDGSSDRRCTILARLELEQPITEEKKNKLQNFNRISSHKVKSGVQFENQASTSVP